MFGFVSEKLCGFVFFAAVVFFGQTALADHYLVGRWLDQTQKTGTVIEIYMEDGDFFLFKKSPQGQTASKRVERKVTDNGVMTFRTLDKDYINNSYVVTRKARQLTVRGRDGQVVATPKLLESEPEPAAAGDDHHDENKDDHHDEKDGHGEKDQHD